jgi:hypothetical protein
MAGIKTLSLPLLFALTACDTAGGQRVGPQGGFIVSDDGRVTLEIPEGALAHEVEITIAQVDDVPAGAVGGAYAIEPALTQLRIPAELTYELAMDDADMADAVIVTARASQWRPLADLEVDEESGLASASVMYFSTVAVVVD